MTDPLVVRCYSDPICPWSWAYEPILRRIQVQFRSQVQIRQVMGGLALERADPASDEQVEHIQESWRRVAQATGQPIDWERAAALRPRNSRPLCEAVVAASLQSYAVGWRYLRLMREAHFLAGVDPYSLEGRLQLARRTPSLDVRRWTQRLESGEAATMTENHFSETRHPSTGAPVEGAGEDEERRYGFPTLVWRDPRTEKNHFFTDEQSLEAHLDALRGGGLKDEPLPTPIEAFDLYPTLTLREVAAVTGLDDSDVLQAIDGLLAEGQVEAADVHGLMVYRRMSS